MITLAHIVGAFFGSLMAIFAIHGHKPGVFITLVALIVLIGMMIADWVRLT